MINKRELSHKYIENVEELIAFIDEPNRLGCLRLYQENEEIFKKAPASVQNHQKWDGGYLDHVREIMNLAIHLYPTMKEFHPLPFTLSDALLVLFLHDLEKPWRFCGENALKKKLDERENRDPFRKQKMEDYGISLTATQENGVDYVEGEIEGKYTPHKRSMNELATFCHMCDVASARLWFDYPKK